MPSLNKEAQKNRLKQFQEVSPSAVNGAYGFGLTSGLGTALHPRTPPMLAAQNTLLCVIWTTQTVHVMSPHPYNKAQSAQYSLYDWYQCKLRPEVAL